MGYVTFILFSIILIFHFLTVLKLAFSFWNIGVPLLVSSLYCTANVLPLFYANFHWNSYLFWLFISHFCISLNALSSCISAITTHKHFCQEMQCFDQILNSSLLISCDSLNKGHKKVLNWVNLFIWSKQNAIQSTWGPSSSSFKCDLKICPCK